MSTASSCRQAEEQVKRLPKAPLRQTPLPLPRTKVGMISLGCAKNLVDAEIMLGSVLQRGMEITSRAEDADVLVVNTCAFIDSAKEESIGAILEAHQQRGLNKKSGQKLIVSGCMSQRFARELREEMPEVDAFIGLDQVGQLGEIVEKILKKRATLNAGNSMLGVDSDNVDADLAFADRRPTYIPDYDTPRFRLTPAHSAYVKIAEGCNHPCSFCVIPQMRGKHRSPYHAPKSAWSALAAQRTWSMPKLCSGACCRGAWKSLRGRRTPTFSLLTHVRSLIQPRRNLSERFWRRTSNAA